MGLGFRELLVILVIVVLVFGARRVPSIMGDLAKGIRSFKDGMKGDEVVDDKSPASRVEEKKADSSSSSSSRD